MPEQDEKQEMQGTPVKLKDGVEYFFTPLPVSIGSTALLTEFLEESSDGIERAEILVTAAEQSLKPNYSKREIRRILFEIDMTDGPMVEAVLNVMFSFLARKEGAAPSPAEAAVLRDVGDRA